MAPAAAGISLWLLMRSFASGCTAMTGVEAVSNGITAFREPAVVNARRTLTLIVVILALLLAGVATLARAYGIGAQDQTRPDYQSVMSQLVAAVVGRGPFYYVAIGSLLCVLALSANTSFVDFPRLCRLIAADGFLPKGFTIVGRRLVYSVGILFLTATAGALLVAFRGITDRLIPLFAVGAFGAFTASQAGMVVHWRRINREAQAHGCSRAEVARNHTRLIINMVGAVTTGAALVVILVAKFAEGAWITLLFLPALFVLFRRVKRHYVRVARQIRAHEPIAIEHACPPVIVLPTEGWNHLTDKSLKLALQISPDVMAVHLSRLDGDEEVRDDRLRRQWAEDVEEPVRQAGLAPPHLDIVHTPYRKFIEPLLKYVERIKTEFPDRQVAVMIPELVKRRWWQFLLHNYRAERLRSALLKSGDRKTVLINVPWYLDDRP